MQANFSAALRKGWTAHTTIYQPHAAWVSLTLFAFPTQSAGVRVLYLTGFPRELMSPPNNALVDLEVVYTFAYQKLTDGVHKDTICERSGHSKHKHSTSDSLRYQLSPTCHGVACRVTWTGEMLLP